MADNEEDDQKSRSQAKREFIEIKELVKVLIELPAWHLNRVPLTERNREEIVIARDLTRSALNRQLRYIVRLVEGVEDIAAIQAAVAEPPPASEEPDEPDEPDEADRQASELIAGDNDLLGQFIDDNPELDHRKLRRFVRAARKESTRASDGPRPAAQALVEYLRGRRANR